MTTERTEYHELLLHLLKSLQRQVDRLEKDRETAVSGDKVADLERRIIALEALIKDLSEKLDAESKLSLVQRVKLGVYVGLTVAVLGLIGAMTVDLWKEAVLPAIRAEKSESD